MGCSFRPTLTTEITWPTATVDDDAPGRLADLLRLIADIAEPAVDADATDLPAGLLDALAAWQTQHRATC